MKNVLIFSLGAAIGSLLAWKILEEKYKRLADEEINSVIEQYKCKDAREHDLNKKDISNRNVEQDAIQVVEHNKPDDYYEKVQKLGYDISKGDGQIISEEKDGSIYVSSGKDYIEPYVISPDEFGEIEQYEIKSWTYYSDGIITDEIGQIVDDPEADIGDALRHFGEYEDDAIHVRNENVECDYEIIKYEKSYKELNGG